MIISLYLAGHNTVWRKNDPKAALTAATVFLEDQDAVLSRSKERTVPVSLWVKRAKSYDLKTNRYGNGCFAFVRIRCWNGVFLFIWVITSAS